MEGDARGFRIALTADTYVNPPPGGLDGLAVLDAAGWGVMQLPAADYPAQVTARILADVAEQVQEFHRHAYDIVLIGGDDGGLATALDAVGVPFPAQIVPSDAAQLQRFLDGRPAPAALRPPGNGTVPVSGTVPGSGPATADPG
ncbi:MAG: hypothetical protein ABJB47_09685 [Actinomycetota bacterium]